LGLGFARRDLDELDPRDDVISIRPWPAYSINDSWNPRVSASLDLISTSSISETM